MSHLSALLSMDDVEAITRLLELAERSPFATFESRVGDMTVRIDRTVAAADANACEVTAPAVGLFKRHEAATKSGELLREGTTIGHIATLDQRTDVVLGQAGAIADWRVQDGQFVEYGQVLLTLAQP